MNNWIFPVEILEVILEDFISEFRDIDPYGSSVKCAPYLQHNLVPLLHICKSWHTIAEKLLYRCVSVGGGVPLGLGQPEGCIPQTVPVCTETSEFRYVPLRAQEVAKKLMATLSTNSRMAALVKDLRLAVHEITSPEWTQTNIHILHTCPNVQHVQIIGFHHYEHNTLSDVLKEKSLVSFCITPRGYSTRQSFIRNSFNLLDVMQSWPRLQTIKVYGLQSLERQNELDPPDAPCVPGCCPELQEIQIAGCILHYSVLESLCVMSGNVTNLSIYTRSWSDDEARLDALCKCLRAWSSTLERLSLCAAHGLIPTVPLHDALSALQGLRKLEINEIWDYGSIADLPLLERLRFYSDYGTPNRTMMDLTTPLNDMQKFPALKHISVCGDFDDRLRDICFERHILVEVWADDEEFDAGLTSW